MKRLLDLVFASLILILFFPIGLIISFLIIFSSKGGVFYRQERIGLYGKPFYILKFRSMRVNSDLSGKLTVGMRDPRITKIGYYLRKYKLDEFPQFINVLKGEMSIVGPRPEVIEYVQLYTEEQLKILNVKPGITDYASLYYFKENELLALSTDPKQTYIDEIMPSKLNLNFNYIKKRSSLMDIKIILLTFGKIFRK